MSLKRRLIPNTDQELEMLLQRVAENTIPTFYADMDRHFALAKEKPIEFSNHKTVLAVAIGGSNTKVMLSEMCNGVMQVHYIKAVINPANATHVFDFLDQVLQDQIVKDYLKQTDEIQIGVVIPMAINNGCALHATKLATITGLVVREASGCVPQMRVDTILKQYFASRGYSKPVLLFYQGDGIVAHHGAVSLDVSISSQDHSVLCVCGTGMATGDEQNYVAIALINTLAEDSEIYPTQETENRQLQYAIAGKGIFALMLRAIHVQQKNKNSALHGILFDIFFQSTKDSKTVFDLYRSMIHPEFTTDELAQMYCLVDQQGIRELQDLSKWIVTRVIQSLSNMIIATFYSMGKTNGKNILYLEGSIAMDPLVMFLLQEELDSKLAQSPVLDTLYEQKPSPICIRTTFPQVQVATGYDCKKLDYTLIGGATGVIAMDCIDKGDQTS